MGAGGGSLIILSLLLLRRKKPYGTISHGVVEVRGPQCVWGAILQARRGMAQPQCSELVSHPSQVDPMLTLEEQQLRELQRHGYENPTYRFLEERP